MESLTERQQSVLNSVVETHIETAAPVGSKALRERFALEDSPATLRHEMNVLENKGYLRHPYTSSGRVPTDTGYRYYVDHKINAAQPQPFVTNRIKDQLLELSREIPEAGAFVGETSRVLSGVIQEASLAIFSMMPEGHGPRIFVQGSSHLLEKPEFQNLQKVRALFRTFEDKEGLMGLVQTEDADTDVMVRIGRENSLEAFQECTVLAARYSTLDEGVGMLAVVGPTRMRYSQALPLLKIVAVLVGEILDDKF